MASRSAHSLLQVGGLPPSLLDMLTSEFTLLRVPDDGGDEWLASLSTDVEIAVTTSLTGVNADLMRAVPGLRAIANFGAGYETTDVEVARELGIVVSNTPDVVTGAVADLTIGMVLDVLRGISAADRYVRQGQWPLGPRPLARDLSGKRVGIVGLGRIGRAVASRFGSFPVTVAYHSRNLVDNTDLQYFSSLLELAEWGDVLIVATAGGAGTAGLISRDILDAVGRDGYLVNVARGSVVDEDALIECLTTGAIAGAALDVFESEPCVAESLFELDNVLLLPHIGSATAETRRAMSALVVDNIRAFVQMGSFKTPV